MVMLENSGSVDYLEYQSFVRSWLDDGIELTWFHPVSRDLLENTLRETIEDPETFKAGVASFVHTILGEGIASEKIDSNVRVKQPEIYIVRILAGGNGTGLNIIFSPGDPSLSDVQKLYREQCEKLEIPEHVMPFDVLWSDAYYFRGNVYEKGRMSPDRDDAEDVFGVWDQTWAIILSGKPLFYKLGGPVFPPEGLHFDNTDEN